MFTYLEHFGTIWGVFNVRAVRGMGLLGFRNGIYIYLYLYIIIYIYIYIIYK